jgi:hydroxyquinol 1,2-dioxygenase
MWDGCAFDARGVAFGPGSTVMREFNEHSLTQEVTRRLTQGDNARANRIMTSMIKHLHDFVRDVEPTFEEWQYAIDFLTRTGQACTPLRQEFILLSDTLGVSMLVDAINHRMPEGTTETTVLGPFYLGEHRVTANGADISVDVEGERMFAEASVKGADGKPLVGVPVDIWHSDDEGFYDAQKDTAGEPSLRGRFVTDANGRIFFKSIIPVSYPIPHDGPVGEMLRTAGQHPMRPAHVHFLIDAPGYEKLITHVFVAGDEYLDSDVVYGVKESLVAGFDRQTAPTYPDGTPAPQSWRHLKYDFVLKPVSAAAAA